MNRENENRIGANLVSLSNSKASSGYGGLIVKKICIVFVTFLLLLSCVGCSASNNAQNGTIKFKAFYKGFTPVAESGETDFSEVTKDYIIIDSEELWQKYCNTYCSTAGTFEIDFSSQCLVAVSSMYGSRANENSSFEITSIKAENGKLTDISTSNENPVYAINLGSGHWFVNIVSVDRSVIVPEKNSEHLYK